jgi:beta-N-acetylhexosaminidase
MGFDGVIITDGIAMKAVTKYAGSQGNAAVKAVQAGNDMICVTGNYRKCYKALCEAADKGKINEKQIDASVKRILMMKIRRGII